MTITVSVCLCTFRRPSLSATLESLAKQVLPPEVAVDVIVVDSDLDGSARTLVEQARERLPLAIRYVVAERKGVAEARNKAVSEASGQWLAFIDDDEFAAPDWLAELLACAERNAAQVVFGEVRTLYPESCPDWIISSDLFGKHLPPTGTRVDSGPTSNALLARIALAGETRIFDLAYGTTGGEDTELFYRLSKRSVPMVSCREAVVSETVEEHRLNRDFLLKKAMRVGETYFRIFFADASPVVRGALLVRAVLQWLAAGSIALILRPFGLGNSMEYQIKAAANLGKLRAATGYAAVELYKG